MKLNNSNILRMVLPLQIKVSMLDERTYFDLKAYIYQLWKADIMYNLEKNKGNIIAASCGM